MQPNGKPPIRQGDVLLIPTDDVPAKRTRIETENGRVILARGEATGHHHSIVLDRGDEAELYSVANEVDTWLRVQRPGTPVVHQEHAAAPLSEPAYIVRIQREYHPGAIRRVAD